MHGASDKILPELDCFQALEIKGYTLIDGSHIFIYLEKTAGRGAR